MISVGYTGDNGDFSDHCDDDHPLTSTHGSNCWLVGGW